MKKQNLMRISILSIAFLATSLLTINAQTVVGTLGRLQTTTTSKNGKQIAIVGDENGNPISLAGMSLFWSNAGDSSDFYNAATVNHLADNWKVSIVRAAMGVKEDWDGGTGYVDNPQGQMTKIRKVIDAAIAKDIYVIVDYHTHNAEDYESEAITFFTDIAKIYGNNDHIIYEIYNEPINQSWSQIKSYAINVIKEIRKEDPDNLIIVGNPQWCQRVDEPAADPIRINGQPDPNLAYTMHFYAGSHEQWLRDRTRKAMEDGAPIFVTEWGSVNADGDGGVVVGETNAWLEFMEDYHLSHANWNLGDKNEGSSVVSSGAGVSGLQNNQLTNAGNFIRTEILEIASNLVLSTENFNLNGEQISLFPNPATDIINLETSKTNITSVKIVDIQGRQVFSNDYNSLKASIDVSSLSKGIYIMEINNTAGTQFVVK